jgi:hypothetical protein
MLPESTIGGNEKSLKFTMSYDTFIAVGQLWPDLEWENAV